MDSGETTRVPSEEDGGDHTRSPSLITRSFHAVGDAFAPFSPAALASLPRLRRPKRYNRADAIPDTSTDDQGQQPTVRDYHSINLPPQVRVPKKIATPVKVEAKVWFANERTWVAWLDMSVLIGTLALALFNASKDQVATNFAYVYALISVGLVVYAFFLHQQRISMIRRRDPGHFDAIAGPVLVGVALFVAILVNFIIRVRELDRKEVPIPGADFFKALTNMSMPLSFHTQH